MQLLDVRRQAGPVLELLAAFFAEKFRLGVVHHRVGGEITTGLERLGAFITVKQTLRCVDRLQMSLK